MQTGNISSKPSNRLLQREVMASAQVKFSCCAEKQCQLSVSLYCQFLKQTTGQGLTFCTKHVELPECNSQSLLAQMKEGGVNLRQQISRKAQSKKEDLLSDDEARNVKGK